MKKAINLIIMYFLFLVAGIVIGTLFYSFYLNVLNFVAGQKLDIFDVDVLMKSLFFVSIAMCFLIFPIISYYRIRHLGGISQTVAYIILTVFTIMVLYPATIQIKKKYYDSFPQGNNISHLSGGYFRQSGDKIYFFTKDFISNPVIGENTTTVIIDTSENGIVTIDKVEDTPDFPLYEDAKPCKEILVKNAFAGTISTQKGGISVLVEKAETAFEKGLSFALGFAIIILTMASMYAVTAFFQWKFINVVLLIFNSGIVILSMGYYSSPAGEKIRMALESNKLMMNLHNYIDDPALICFYLIFSLVMIITGIVTYCVKKHKKKA